MIFIIDPDGLVVDLAWTMAKARQIADYLTRTTKRLHTVRAV